MRSVLAILAGIVAVVVLSIGTDMILSETLFPGLAHGDATTTTWLIVTGYRCLYSVVGGYIAARLAPSLPMRHALILGVIGLALGVLGIVVAPNEPGPTWYPIAVAVQALPFAWLGGWIGGRRV